MNNSYPFWLKGTLILIGICLFFVILSVGKFILMPLAYAALLAMLLEPVSFWLERWKVNRVVAILLSMLLLVVFLGGIMSLLSIQFVQFGDRLPEANQKIQDLSKEWLGFFQSRFNISPEQQVQFLQQGLSTIVNKSDEYLSAALEATTSVFTNLTLIPLFVFFMMYYKKMYIRFLHWLFTSRKRKAIDSVVGEIQNVTQNYIIGLIMVITILTVLNALGLWIVGLENALFFSIFAAVLAIIPYIGIIIGSLPAVLFGLLFSDSLFTPLAVIGVFALVQFLEGNFITPNIIGTRVSINPFIALIALLVGGELWGITGMILFVPYIGILKCIFDRVEELRPYGYLLGSQQEINRPPETAKKSKAGV